MSARNWTILLATLAVLTIVLAATAAANGDALAITGPQGPEVPENGTPVASYTTNAADNTTVAWSLAGADKDVLTITEGALKFSAAPNQERPSDHNADNVYEATVVARTASENAELDVRITVIDVNEPPSLLTEPPTVNLETGTTIYSDLNTWFQDPEGNTLTFSVITPIDTALQATIDGNLLKITASGENRETSTTIKATDAQHTTSIKTTLRITTPSARQLPPIVRPSPPGNLQAEPAHNGFTLTWNEPHFLGPGPLFAYTIEYRVADTTDHFSGISHYTTSYSLTGLEPATSYEIRIEACSYGPPQSIVIIVCSRQATITATTLGSPDTSPDFGTQTIGTISPGESAGVLTVHDDRSERWTELPTATGGDGNLTYKIVSRSYEPGGPPEYPHAPSILPLGINITLLNGTRYLEGQPEGSTTDYLLKYVVVDEDGDMDSIDFAIHLNRVPYFEHTGYTGTFLINVESSLKLPEASGGDGNLRYWVTQEDLGEHLGFDTAKMELFGNVPTAGQITMTYNSADEDNDTKATSIILTVENRLEAPAGVNLTPASDNAAIGPTRTALLTWEPSQNANADTVYDVYLAPPFEERYIHPATLPIGDQNANGTSRIINLEHLPQYPTKNGLRSFPYLEAWIVARDDTRSMLPSQPSEEITITPGDITKVDGESDPHNGGRAKVTWTLDSRATSYTLRWRALGNDRNNRPHTSYQWFLDDTALNPQGGHKGETSIHDLSTRPSCGEQPPTTEQEACIEISGLTLDTVYAIQLNYTRRSEDGKIKRIFSGRDFYAYPSTASAGNGERIASILLRKFIADSDTITYAYTFCEETFPPKPEGTTEHPYLTYIKHAAQQWEYASAGLVRALPILNPEPCTDYTQYLPEAVAMIERYVMEETGMGNFPPTSQIEEQARRILKGYKKREIASTRSNDLERNEIEMIDYSEFDQRPAADAFPEIARIINARYCRADARGCALYYIENEETNQSTVDIVFNANNALEELGTTLPQDRHYPGGNTTWDPTDVQFNACPSNTILYGTIVHELGHTFGLHAGRANEANFSEPNAQNQFHPSDFLIQSAMSERTDAKCSPHPLDVMAIYALYQNAANAE